MVGASIVGEIAHFVGLWGSADCLSVHSVLQKLERIVRVTRRYRELPDSPVLLQYTRGNAASQARSSICAVTGKFYPIGNPVVRSQFLLDRSDRQLLPSGPACFNDIQLSIRTDTSGTIGFGTAFEMLRLVTRLIDAVTIICVALVCVALVAAPTRALEAYSHCVTADEVDPLEEDGVPAEDPIDEAGSVPTRVRTRSDLRSYSAAIGADIIRISSSRCRPRTPTVAGTAGALIGRNGCGATLRC